MKVLFTGLDSVVSDSVSVRNELRNMPETIAKSCFTSRYAVRHSMQSTTSTEYTIKDQTKNDHYIHSKLIQRTHLQMAVASVAALRGVVRGVVREAPPHASLSPPRSSSAFARRMDACGGRRHASCLDLNGAFYESFKITINWGKMELVMQDSTLYNLRNYSKIQLF